MRGEEGRLRTDLVAQALGGNDGDFIADALVGLEVEGELGVVALDDDLGRLLDRLRPDATHVGSGGCVGEGVVGGWRGSCRVVRRWRFEFAVRDDGGDCAARAKPTEFGTEDGESVRPGRRWRA